MSQILRECPNCSNAYQKGYLDAMTETLKMYVKQIDNTMSNSPTVYMIQKDKKFIEDEEL